MNRLVRLCVATLLIATAPLIAMAAVPNYQGIWWNAPAGSESGWGINFAHQGDIIFAAWYTYDATGRAWWLTMNAEKTGPNTYAGKLSENRGPALNGAFNTGLVQQFEVGDGTLTFSDADHGTFHYTVNGITQEKALVRLVFGAMPTCTWGAQANLALATNYQDMWWVTAGAESGWGVNFTHQGDTLFVAWFSYDLDGKPLWLWATTSKSAAGVYTGKIHRNSGPAFSAANWSPTNIMDSEVGDLTITFANGNSASFHYTLTLGAPPVPIVATKSIERFVFRAPGTVCAEASVGVATAEGIWRGTTNQGQAVTIVILDDGTFYIVFSAQGTTAEAGALHGSSSSVNGIFNATSVTEIPFSPNPAFIGGAAGIHGTYVPRTTLQLTIGSSSVTASYDPTYDQSGNLASLAGDYEGFIGHIAEQGPAMSSMDTQGNLTIYHRCITTVSATPRGTVNIFNMSVSANGCFNGPGILFYDSARRKLYALAVFSNGSDMWYAIGTRQ